MKEEMEEKFKEWFWKNEPSDLSEHEKSIIRDENNYAGMKEAYLQGRRDEGKEGQEEIEKLQKIIGKK